MKAVVMNFAAQDDLIDHPDLPARECEISGSPDRAW